MAWPAEISRDITHRAFQRRFCDTHHVVMRHHALGPEIGEGEEAAPFGIRAWARAQTAVKEKQEISIVMAKFRRVVSTYFPFSSSLSE